MKKEITIILPAILLIQLFFCSNSYSQLSGNYVIGPGGDYLSITDAVNALEINGVNGPVVINIVPGIYDEAVTIDSIRGTSLINTVTFQSSTGVPADVTWSTSNTAYNFLLKINGADNITLKNITFKDSLQYEGYMRLMLLITGFVNNLKITGNYFRPFYQNYNTYTIYGFATSTNDLLISENSIFGDYCINFEAVFSTLSNNTKITGNYIRGSYNIILTGHNNTLIEKNEMHSYLGIFLPAISLTLNSCSGNLKIIKNIISANGGFHGSGFGLVLQGCNFESSLIANNFVTCSEEGKTVTVSNCSNLNIFFNSFYGYGQFAINFRISGTMNCSVINNIISGSIISYQNNSNSFLNSNFNAFAPKLPYFAYFNGVGFGNLIQFRTISHNDSNSVLKSVSFADNLHLSGSSIGDTSLKGIPLASVTDDIDGDLRNPLYPYMGADEAVVPLPVELFSFSFLINSSEVILNWSTSSEVNNSGFDLERSNVKDQTLDDWLRIGFIKGNGTSNSSNNYSYSDRNLNSGKYKYRLKQIDYNGNYEYYNLSNQVVISVPDKYSLSQNYPNPFNPVTHLGFGISNPVFVSLKVYDILGNEIKTLVNEIKPAGYYDVEFNGSDLSSGIYFYKLGAGSFKETKRMLMIK